MVHMIEVVRQGKVVDFPHMIVSVIHVTYTIHYASPLLV